MILSVLTWASLGPAALAMIAIALIAGLLCSGCGPSPPPKWSNFRDQTPAADPDEEDR